ncbi:class I SAM-dependent methyltransferase [Marinospirillum sp.]|uniref:class I SAM-dependent methyltransferase n=1 Tax=Marinospirillum sp. TaxID=2183934 RepID=UPI003A8A6468
MSDSEQRSTGWQLDRSAPEAYEAYLVPPMFAPWAERLLDRATAREGERVLDVACGTGIVARRAAPRVGAEGTVVGLDVNEGMLAEAKANAPAGEPGIEWRQGDAANLPFDDGNFDVVCCQQALQFFDDPAAALGEIHRVLAPGGRAALSVWRPLEYNPGYVVLADALERHVSDEAAAMMRSPFPAWELDDLREIADETAFDEPTVSIEVGSVRYPSVEEFVRREAASSPLSASLAGVEPAVREALVEEVRSGLRDRIDDEGIVHPMETYVLAGRA